MSDAATLILEAILLLDEMAPFERRASLAAIHAQVALDALIQETGTSDSAPPQDNKPESWRTRLHNSIIARTGDPQATFRPPS